MKGTIMLLRLFLATICLLGSLNAVQAAITPTGNISPANLADWNSTTDCGVGSAANGSLLVETGSDLTSRAAHVGLYGNAGVATIYGSGSTWTVSSLLAVGYQSGYGALNIQGGGAFIGNLCYVGDNWNGSMGMVTVNGIGSTWTNSSHLFVGQASSGTLNVTGGGTVTSGTSGGETFIGHSAGSVGVVTVNGNGSTLTTNNNAIYLGHSSSSSGNIYITDGGGVSSGAGLIGVASGSSGIVAVDGTGSTWTSSASLAIGLSGNGTLNITGSGTVTATNVSINNQSLLTMDVGNGSLLILGGGNGSFGNNGTVRISAAANAAPGTYSPILAGNWSGSGTYQALGGTWNTSTHQFSVSAAETGASGETVVMALSAGPRVVFDDAGGTGWSVGASFAPTSGSGTLSFAATTISGGTLSALETLAGESQSVLGGWEFTASEGYTQGRPVYLTFDVGEGFSADGLQVWHNHDGSWSPYGVSDLTYDGRYASFTVTGFSGYAVTTVPEPGTLALLTAALLGLGLLWRTCRESK
jgi:T5SS/PEP-CTERM-associated repeat protein